MNKMANRGAVKCRLGLVGAGAALVATLAVGSTALAQGSVTYSGQGLTEDAGELVLEDEQCGEDGEEFLLWVFTATRSGSAEISGPWGTAEMTKRGNGAFHYVSDFFDLETLIGNVSATHDGPDKNPQLVISHGCGEPPIFEPPPS